MKNAQDPPSSRSGFDSRARASRVARLRADHLDEETIRRLVQAGVGTLDLDVASGSPRILAATRPGATLDQVESAVRLARRSGLAISCRFAVGHPGETLADLRDTVDYITRLDPDRLVVSRWKPDPGGEPGRRRAPTDPARGARMGDAHGEPQTRHQRLVQTIATDGASPTKAVTPGQLRFFQIWAHVHLHLGNGRLRELARLAWRHRRRALIAARALVARGTGRLAT